MSKCGSNSGAPDQATKCRDVQMRVVPLTTRPKSQEATAPARASTALGDDHADRFHEAHLVVALLQQLLGETLRDFPGHRRVVDVERDAVRSLPLRVNVVAVVAEHRTNVLARSLNPGEFEAYVYVVAQLGVF
jgi:hypothetical protein